MRHTQLHFRFSILLFISAAVFLLFVSLLILLKRVTLMDKLSLAEGLQRNIYCEGELLNDVQLGQLYSDSKTFVDLKLRFTEAKIIKRYAKLKKKCVNAPSVEILQRFISENFEEDDGLEPWIPPDFSGRPSIVNKVHDPLYKQWALDLNNIWQILARRVKDDVWDHPNLYSLIPVPNGFIIPGGRFRELYYWDTFWIINGLILCDMSSTARGVIENLISLVEQFGFVPNGSRRYYLNRSQPPLLIQMIHSYLKMTNDFQFVKDNLMYLEEEFQYWMRFKMVEIQKDGKTYKLARYFVYSRGPRPESYREDFEAAKIFETEEQKVDFYSKIKSVAESGLDFSTRWFVKDGENKGNLTNIAAPQIIPVDLNSFLHSNAALLSKWHLEIGNTTKAKLYYDHSLQLYNGIKEILWDEEAGVWLDYDIVLKKRRPYFYASNLTPIWTESYDTSWSQQALSDRVMAYLKKTGLNRFQGGIPTSFEESGEQWDFPNAWPPYQAIIIQGLDKIGTVESQKEAFRLADLWIKSNYKGFVNSKAMFEKHNVLKPGTNGEGGEYISQTGFGWTNGVTFEFLNRWGDQLEAVISSNDKDKHKNK